MTNVQADKGLSVPVPEVIGTLNGEEVISPSARAQKITTPDAGSGYLHLSTTGPRARFSTLQATYPLKLLAPSPLPSQPPKLALGYTLAYGGGLVAGDTISLRVTIEREGGVVLLTQGSTKVFKHRPGIRPLSHAVRSCDVNDGVSKETRATNQRLHVTVQPGAFILLLPDSVSPFSGSLYRQSQRFVLDDETSSAFILDWVNSGRGTGFGGGPGEIWAMEGYDSTNELWVGGEMTMRERMNLVNPQRRGKDGLTDVARRMAPYHIYATLLVYGPHFGRLLEYMRHICDKTTQYQLKEVPGLIWSYSDTQGEGGASGVIRIAATSVEDARVWIRTVLLAGGIKQLVGDGVWPRVI